MNSNHDDTSSSSSSAPAAAAEAIRKAKEIAARLSAQTQVHTLPLGGAIRTNTTATNAAGDGNSSSPNEDNSSSSNILNGSSGGSHKRKRWGVLPADDNDDESNNIESARAAAAAAAAAAPPTAIEPITKRVWVSGVTEDKPAAHFVAYGKRHIAEIIERLTGEKQKPMPMLEDVDEDEDTNNKKEATAKAEDPTKLSISFQGKGSDPHKAVLPGVPEEPLHCRVQGPTKLLVDEAASDMEDVLQEAANVPTDTEAVAAHERALVLTQSLSLDQILAQAANRTPGAYRPASVAALIHGHGSNNSNMALPADKLAAALLHGSAAAVNKEIHVPNGLVGFLIGRGGENIARMQALTGCKVQIQKEHELQPGQTFRIITLSAATEEAVEECERLIHETVQERTNYHQRGGAGGGGGTFAAAPSSGVSVDMDVPDADIGLIIGKMGATIKAIQDESGANIQVPKTGNVSDPTKRTLTITHANEQGANLAKQLIQNTLASKPSYANNNSQQAAPVPTTASIQVLIPDKDVGLCIGRQGCVIKYMQGTTQCRIQIPPHAPPGQTHRIATVSGPTPEACATVQQMIDRIVQEQSSASVMSGAALHPQQPMGHAQQQQYQQQQQQQQGYSAEWAAYHAAQQASAQLLQQQQQQQQAAAAQVAVPATQQQGADAYYEQFFRYAYYYGEDAARQYYGAWSPPPGTPNPYGVNPAGLAPAPATTSSAPEAAATSATAAPASAPTTAAPTPAAPVAVPSEAARETGRRHVSNLPAWMTQK